MPSYATNPADFYTGAPLPGFDFKAQFPAFTMPEFAPNDLVAAAENLAPSTSPSPSKPGSESPFANALVGGSLLFEGLGNLISGIRGTERPPQGMAMRIVSDYIAQQRDEDRLNKILDRIGGAKTDASSVLASAFASPAALKTDNPLRGLG